MADALNPIVPAAFIPAVFVKADSLPVVYLLKIVNEIQDHYDGNNLVLRMNFFQYLFCNQYAEISGRGGDGRKAQMNTLILSTALITLYIIIVFVMYGRFFPGFLEKTLSMGSMSGKSIGRLLTIVIGIIVFFVLKYFIGSKTWYNQTVEQFKALPPDEQKKAAKKGIRYLLIASLPVIVFIGWALTSLF